MSHSGDGYDLFEAAAGEKINGKTRVSGVVGVGGSFKVGPMLKVRVDAEDNLFSSKFTGATSGSQTESKFNNDIVVAAGLSIGFGK